MERLPEDMIRELAQRFCIATDDRIKQDLVDQLGFHPVNHAHFIDQMVTFNGGHLSVTYHYDFAAYLDCTKHIQPYTVEVKSAYSL